MLGLLAEGYGVGPIARRLFISESTTKTHISKIYDKLGAGNRAQAIMKAIQAGLITPETNTAGPRNSTAKSGCHVHRDGGQQLIRSDECRMAAHPIPPNPRG